MKVDYNVILESYNRANQEFLDECLEIAFEADQTTNVASASVKVANQTGTTSTLNQSQGRTDQTVDTTSSGNQIEPTMKHKQNIIQKIRNIIDKVVEMIKQASIKILNRLKLLVESDKSFFNTLSSKRATVKPLKNFKAITYQYDEQYLESTVKGIQELAIQSITKLANPSVSVSDPKVKSVVESESSTVISNLLSYFGKDKSREGGYDVQSFTREMIDTYRGEKKESMWNESKIPLIMKSVHTTNELSNKCNAIIDKCKNTLNDMKRMESKARLAKTTEELTNISKAVTKATSIYNALLAVTRMYYELKIESSLSAKMLLKKFYQF